MAPSTGITAESATSPLGVPLVDVATLARRLGVAPSTIHWYLKTDAPWLPKPTMLAGRLVWLADDLAGIESTAAEHRRPRGNPAWTAAARARREASPTV